MFGALPIGLYPFGGAPLAAAVAAASFERIIMLSPWDSDAAALSATQEIATLPVANLQDYRPRKVYRSGAPEAYVTASFAEAIAANMLAIRHTMTAAGVFRVWLADTVANTILSPAVDTGWQSVWPATGKPALPNWPSFSSALRWSNDALYPAARIGFADPGASSFDIGRLALGRYWQPTINVDWNPTLAYAPRDVQVETDYGQVFTDRRQASAGRGFRLAFQALNKREVMDGLNELIRLRGLWGDVFVFLDLDAADFQKLSMQAVFTTPTEHQIVPYFDTDGDMIATASITLREVL